MSEFIFTYHGGNKPTTPEEGAESMKKWQAWAQTLGDALVNPGSPVSETKVIGENGVQSKGSANPISGFSIVKAASLTGATELLKDCPHLEFGGTLEISEIVKMA